MHKNSLFLILAGLAVLLSTTFCSLTSRPALQFMPDKMTDAKVGQSYKVDIVISGNVTPVGDISVDVETLPPGLEFAFDDQTRSATLSGTPSKAGTYQFTVSAWCLGTNVSGQTGDKQYTLVVGE